MILPACEGQVLGVPVCTLGLLGDPAYTEEMLDGPACRTWRCFVVMSAWWSFLLHVGCVGLLDGQPAKVLHC